MLDKSNMVRAYIQSGVYCHVKDVHGVSYIFCTYNSLADSTFGKKRQKETREEMKRQGFSPVPLLSTPPSILGAVRKGNPVMSEDLAKLVGLDKKEIALYHYVHMGLIEFYVRIVDFFDPNLIEEVFTQYPVAPTFFAVASAYVSAKLHAVADNC